MSKLQRYRMVEDEPLSRFARMVQAVRSYTLGPLTSNSKELADRFGHRKTATGLAISERSALNYAAVWAATNTISSDVGTFPLLHYKRLQDGGKERLNGSKVYRLLHDQPNPEMTSVVWRRTVQAHALTWGNGYSEIERDDAGRPLALWPITPDRVTPFRQSQGSALQYHVSNPSGGAAIIDAANMIHVPGLGFDGTCGYSVIAKAAESIGLGVAAEQFGGTFFGNGATFGGVVSYRGPKPPELSDKNYVDALKAKHQGVEKAHQLLALYNDATYARMGIPPNDAQFLETRQFQVTEIARWFNIPPHKLGDLTRATFSNIEQQTIDYYTTTLMPWLAVWEQELTIKLVPSLERNLQFIEHMVDGLLRGDISSRSTAYGQQFNVGGITPDEIRASENRNKITGGDRAFVMRNMVPLDRIDEIIDAEIAKATAPVVPTVPTPTVPTGAREIEELTKELALARRKSQEAEDSKDHANALLVERAAELMREQDAHVETRTAKDAEILRLNALAKSLGTDLATATADASNYRRDFAETLERAVGAEAERDGFRVEHDEAVAREAVIEAERASLTERVDRLGDDLGASQRDCATALSLAAEAEHHRDEARSEAATAMIERDEAQRLAESDRQQHTSQIESLSLDIVVARQETERADVKAAAAEHRTAVSEAVVAELRTQVVALTAEDELRQSALTDLAALATRREVERDELRVQRDEAAASLATADATARGRASAMLPAHRTIFADAMGRMVRREVAKARNYRATPAKLRTWLESFYDATERTMFVEALLPSVRVHLAWTGDTTEPSAFADALVTAHFEASRAKLEGILDAGPDGYQELLQRVLDRWELERAEQFADGMVKQEMAHGR